MISINKIYNILFTIFLIVLNLYAYLDNYNIFLFDLIIKIAIGTTFFLLVIFGSYNLIHRKATLNKLTIICILLLLIVIGVLYHVINLVGLGLVSLLALKLNKNNLIKEYFFALSIAFIIIAVLSLLNFIPNSDLLGFTIKNTTGYFIGCTALTSLFLYKNSKYLKYMLILLAAIIIWVIYDDRTMSIILFMFLILYKFRLFENPSKRIQTRLIILLPFLLTTISFIFILFLDNSSFIHNIDNMLSYRISIWNSVYKNTTLSLFPQSVNSSFYISSFEIGQSMFYMVKVSGLDGFFALSPVQYGLIITVIFLIILFYSLKILLNTPVKNRLLLCLSICWIFLGFSETIIVLYNLSFLIPSSFNIIFNNIQEDNNYGFKKTFNNHTSI